MAICLCLFCWISHRFSLCLCHWCTAKNCQRKCCPINFLLFAAMSRMTGRALSLSVFFSLAVFLSFFYFLFFCVDVDVVDVISHTRTNTRWTGLCVYFVSIFCFNLFSVEFFCANVRSCVFKCHRALTLCRESGASCVVTETVYTHKSGDKNEFYTRTHTRGRTGGVHTMQSVRVAIVVVVTERERTHRCK